ncbi:MAG: DUF4870 domain-containing protein [Ginsengibacter sp.]
MMNQKNLSLISYCTIIGWVISFSNYSKGKKSDLLQYHLKQSFGIFVIVLAWSIGIYILEILIPGYALLLSCGLLMLFILLVMGMINAANEAIRPIPLIGKFFENKFTFIQ